MSQNTSSAVMARRVEPPDSLDFFPTPPWATRALIEHVIVGHGWRRDQLAGMTCWEPACGEGHMAAALAETFGRVHSSDVHDYGAGEVHDFLMPGRPLHKADWIITNPPFRLARDFVLRGLEVARIGVAMLARTAFLEGAERYRTLFRPHPPAVFAPFVERVPMLQGRLERTASSATSYSWLVWKAGGSWSPPQLVWIPPCRKALERPHDYEDWTARDAYGTWLHGLEIQRKRMAP